MEALQGWEEQLIDGIGPSGEDGEGRGEGQLLTGAPSCWIHTPAAPLGATKKKKTVTFPCPGFTGKQ